MENYLYPSEDEPLWTYKLDFAEEGKQVLLRVLLDTRIKLFANPDKSFLLQEIFTYNKDIPVGKTNIEPAQKVILETLFHQLWKEGLLTRNTEIILYPGHFPKSKNTVLEIYLHNQRFKKYINDTLERWKPTLNKSLIRSQNRHNKISFSSEFNSLYLSNEIHKKNVLIIDDFTTTGLSLEAAKNLLLNTEAEKIVLCSIGKFTRSTPNHRIYEVKEPFNPYEKEDKLEKDTGYILRDVQADYHAQHKIQKHFKILSMLVLFTKSP